MSNSTYISFENGADVNTKSNIYRTPFMIASREKNLEIVKYLVEHRADLNSTNKLNQSALIFAAQRGHLEIVKYLVENGADVNSMDENDLMYSINIRF